MKYVEYKDVVRLRTFKLMFLDNAAEKFMLFSQKYIMRDHADTILECITHFELFNFCNLTSV